MQPSPDSGHRLALLVATSAYSDPDLRQLRSPGHDADQLAAVLRDPQIGGFDVQVLINPVSGEVQEGIEDFCTDRHPDDQLLIYLSCHGVLDSYGRLYYAAANTRRQRLAATAVAAAWLNERLEDCRARRQILVLDCCHSGAFAGAKGGTDLALQHRFEPHSRGRVVLTASRSTEYSFEGGQASGEGVPSVFTDAIVNGLRTGDADRDRDGLITVTDLYQYVYVSVRAAEPRQTPELWTYGVEGNLLVAHSVHGAVIEPESLPENLRVTLESPRSRVRETGVGELADPLDDSGPGRPLAARPAREQAEAQEEQETHKIFLCYRREDTQGFARGIYQSLADKYGRGRVSRDIDSTPAGTRFSAWIESRVGQCSVMLVLIGDAWSSAKDHAGQRRLDLPKDWVRQEIEAALRRDIPIIPVRVQGASMPSEDELPPSIADLAGFQSAEVTDSRWDFDIGRLIQAIDNLMTPD